MSPPTFLSFVLLGVYGIMFLLVSYYIFIKQSHDNLLEEIQRRRFQACIRYPTCDETWIYQYDPETKQQSSVWCFLEMIRL